MELNARDRLVVDHMYLADQIASKRMRTVSNRVAHSEIKSAAYFGLIDAANKFDSTKNASFPSYARWRIAGEINDYLRKCSWGKRSNPVHSRPLDVLVYRDRGQSAKSESLEDALTADSNFIDQLNSAEFFAKLTRCLPSKVRQIMHLYYIKNETMHEISAKVGLSESRVSQLIKQYLAYLKSVWSSRKDELWDEIDTQSREGSHRQHAQFKMQYKGTQVGNNVKVLDIIFLHLWLCERPRKCS